jgi:CRP-like cAMP-binding protein
LARSARKPSAALRKLAERAQTALESDQIDEALSLYAQLEEQDAADPEWPRQLASLYRRTGAGDEELDALVRCADRHAAREEFFPALATYKMILSIDPGHLVAQERLSDLQPDDTIEVHYADDAAPAAPAPAAAEGGPSSAAPLDELTLTEIIAGAHPAQIADDTLDGVHEIPLEEVVTGPRQATRSRRKARRSSKRESDSTIQAAQLEESLLFHSLDRKSLADLVRQVRLVELRAGEELFHQGDPAGALYIVAQGAVVPIAESEDEEPRTRLAVLEPGEFFGEIALFTNQPRNATVEALVDSQLLSIDRSVMWKLVRKHPKVLSQLLQFLRERLIHRLVRTSPVFQIFATTKRSAIARRFRFLEVADGKAVINQHHPAEGVFILLSGQMEVVHEDDETGADKCLATLRPGELFGEMSLLWREPSLASVIARGKCWLLALPAQSFQQMLDHHPELAELAARIAEERRSENKRTLRDALGHRDGEAGII